MVNEEEDVGALNVLLPGLRAQPFPPHLLLLLLPGLGLGLLGTPSAPGTPQAILPHHQGWPGHPGTPGGHQRDTRARWAALAGEG